MSPPAIDPHARVLMTLAGIAYGRPSAIPDYLEQDGATQGDWSVAWSAASEEVPVNFAFIAYNARTNTYAVVIRGTYPNPFNAAYWDDAQQDNPLGEMQSWPIGGTAEAKISAGTARAFANLIALTDGRRTLQQAIENIPASAELYVTGHSLGGTLAPVIALWITSLPGTPVPSAYCFAGMTPGNHAFANLFGESSVLSGRVWRYNNTLDSVPYGWNDVIATRDFYSPAPRGGLFIEAAVTTLAVKLHSYGYVPVGEAINLIGTLSPSGINCEVVAFVIENLRQHLPDTYLKLLDAPPLPFNIGLGAVVVPKDDRTAQPLAASRIPVYYL